MVLTSTPPGKQKITVSDARLVSAIDLVIAGRKIVGTIFLARTDRMDWFSEVADQDHSQEEECGNRSSESHKYLLRLRCDESWLGQLELRSGRRAYSRATEGVNIFRVAGSV
jgi:hypothetical protein